MTVPQPLPRAGAATITAHAAAEFDRLLAQWVDLARRVAEACGHQHSNEAALQRSQLLVEADLESRFPRRWAAVRDDAIAWEATLLHTADGQPAAPCLHCRRGRSGLPADLLAPPAGGSR